MLTSMVKIYLFLFSLLFPCLAGAQNSIPPILDFSQFEPLLQKNNDTVYVLNFWATWCKPCVEELPIIESVHDGQFEVPVKVILVSLDFRNQVESKLVPFIREKNIRSQVVVIDDPDANAWIDKVDPRWSGALPATIIYKKNQRRFITEAFDDYESIKNIIESF